MSHTTIVLFGALHLQQDGVPRLVHGRKNRLLLAYLALHRDTLLSRERSAATLWPDVDETRGREGLRHALSRLRMALRSMAPAALQADAQTISLRSDELEIDLATVEALLRAGARTRGAGAA